VWLCVAAAETSAPARLAVLPVRLTNAATAEVQGPADRAALAAARTVSPSALDPAAVRATLKAKGKERLIDCVDLSCAVEALGVSALVRTSVRKPAVHWIVTVDVVDVTRRPAAVSGKAVEHAPAGTDALVAALPQLVRQALGVTAPPGPSAAPPSTAPRPIVAPGCNRTAKEIVNGLVPRVARMDDCASDVRRGSPSTTRVDLEYLIGIDGGVRDVRVSGAGTNDAALTRCFAEALAGLSYPADARGVCPVRLPVNLGGAMLDIEAGP
jgi:hypothetical protein